MSLLVVMGSGETAPAMVKVHRAVFASLGHQHGPAVLVDTPFGFQANADDLTARTRAYFDQSVGQSVDVARWRRRDAPLVDQEAALSLLSTASWVFAGPGSPSYALRQWEGTPVPGAFTDVLQRGGVFVAGSAAAVTIGSHAIPVYEIYKVGADPEWLPGLDLLGRLAGIRAAVVPHYDNAEGGTYDTRYCYLGEARLALLETALPADAGVLGVDEHTALLIDLVRRTATVAGSGLVTVRSRAGSTTFAADAVLGFDDLSALLRGESAAAATGGPTLAVDPAPGSARPAEQPSLGAEARRCAAAFDAALAAADVDGCVEAVLTLETALQDWSADTLQSSDADSARRALRSMVVRLGELAKVGARDPREVVGPYVEVLLDLRRRAREARDFASSDLVRDRLGAAGVEVRDTATGMEWSLR